MNQKHIHIFTNFLKDRGYAKSTISLYIRVIEKVQINPEISTAGDIYQHITRILETRETFSPAIRRYLKPVLSLYFLMQTRTKFKDYSHLVNNRTSKYHDILDEFYEYSVRFKSMSEMSARAERQHISEFLDYLNCMSVKELSTLKATDVRDYVCNRLSRCKPSSQGRYITSIKNFFRFLEYKEIPVSKSVLELPLTSATRKKANVPVILTKDEEDRLRSRYTGDNHRCKRNNIIILLMLELGMRCTEVASIRLSDISWHDATIKLQKTKTKKERLLPISKKLGKLLEEYVINYRPHTNNEYLFLRKGLYNQYVPMNFHSIRSVVRNAFQKENITGWWKGTHALRRTAASHIFNAGNGIKLTADILGHKSLDSTTAYIKVDFESLRKTASRWPGGVSHE